MKLITIPEFFQNYVVNNFDTTEFSVFSDYRSPILSGIGLPKLSCEQFRVPIKFAN
jgi:hypothetical protein